MAALTADPTTLSISIRVHGGAYTLRSVRARAGRPLETTTRSLAIGGGYADNATLSKVGSASWMTLPATCTDATPFDVDIDVSDLKPGTFTETIRAEKATWDSVDVEVTLAVRPSGGKP